MLVHNDDTTVQNVSTAIPAAQPQAITITPTMQPSLVEQGYVRGWQHGHYAVRQLYHLLAAGGC